LAVTLRVEKTHPYKSAISRGTLVLIGIISGAEGIDSGDLPEIALQSTS
jgi:hypothetical protein